MNEPAGAVPGREPGASAGFYVTGGTVPVDAPSYVARQADRDLLGGLLQSEFCYVLTSRQMGKSSLMVRTAQKLRDRGVQVVVLDLTAFGQNLTPEQWYGGLLQRLGRQLRLEDELDDFWWEQTRLGPCQRFFAALREVALVRRTGSLVIFVDELDVIRSLPFGTDEFLAAIRGCFNDARVGDPEFSRLSFCLLGVATPTELVKDPNNTPFNIGRRVVLTDFTATEAAPLARGFERAGWDQAGAQAVLERVLYWTNGHPYLTQRLCRELASRSEEVAKQSASAAVDRFCHELFLTSRARTEDDNLLFVRERLLRSEAGRHQVLQLYRKVRKGRRVRDNDSNPVITAMLLAGVVRLVHGNLAERNRIYHEVFDHEWIAANLLPAERGRRFFKPAPAFAVAFAVLALTLALGLWQSRRNPASSASKEVALGVLPVTVLGQQGPDDPAHLGLMESLAGTLAQVHPSGPVIRVVPPRELRSAAATNAIKARRAFGVDRVLAAMLDPVNSPGLLRLELVDSRTSKLLESRVVDFTPDDLRRVHQSLADTTASWLRLRDSLPSPGTNARPATYYFQGLGLLGESEAIEDAVSAAGLLRQAAAAFGEAVQLDGGFVEARVSWATTALGLLKLTHQSSWLDMAESNAVSAVQMAPASVPALLTMSAVLRASGKVGEAAPLVEDARRIDPDGAEVLEEMARVYEADQKRRAAESLLKNAQEKYPERWTITAALGRLYGVWNKHDKAIPLLEDVVKRVPHNPKARINLANAYFSLGRDAEAIAASQQALDLAPSAAAHNTLGTVLYQQRKYVDAAEQFSKALARNPSDHALWGGLGDACRMMIPPQTAEAAQAYQTAKRLAEADLAVNPSDTFAGSGLALYLAHLGEKPAALKQIHEVLAAKPESDDWFIASLVFEAVGEKRAEAIRCLERALQENYSMIIASRYPDLSDLLQDEKAQAIRERLASVYKTTTGQLPPIQP